MKRIQNLSRGAWMMIGVLVALVLVPTAAVAAATTIVRIKGPSGNAADVTANLQLLTTEAKPTSYRIGAVSPQSFASGADCQVLATPPAGSALILTQLQLDPYDVLDPTVLGAGHATPSYLYAYAEPAGTPCTFNPGSSVITSASFNTPGESTTIPLTPGFAVPAGYQVTIEAFNVDVQTFAYGYTVPATDVGATPAGRTSILHHHARA